MMDTAPPSESTTTIQLAPYAPAGAAGAGGTQTAADSSGMGPAHTCAPVFATGFSPEEIEDIQERLGEYIAPDDVSFRTQPGGYQNNVAYVEGHTAIGICNDLFGFGRWSSTILNHSVDYLDLSKDSKWSAGVQCIVRITLANGAWREDLGYGTVDGVPKKGMALEKAKKEAITDAMKRAFRQFGNLLGNCLYDKEYNKVVYDNRSKNITAYSQSIRARATERHSSASNEENAGARLVNRRAPRPRPHPYAHQPKSSTSALTSPMAGLKIPPTQETLMVTDEDGGIADEDLDLSTIEAAQGGRPPLLTARWPNTTRV